MSRPRQARNKPVNPPMMNRPMKPRPYSIGVSQEIEPLYKVDVQLKTLTAEGIATRKLRNENVSAAYADSPVRNMWCAQTKKPMTAIAIDEPATNEYPKIGLRAKV